MKYKCCKCSLEFTGNKVKRIIKNVYICNDCYKQYKAEKEDKKKSLELNHQNILDNEDDHEDALILKYSQIEDEESLDNDSDDEYEDTIRRNYYEDLDRDALEFSDPDDYYRNDDFDNETLWNDADDKYDDGWRR